MADTVNVYTADGVTTDFTISFTYLDEDFITVLVEDEGLSDVTNSYSGSMFDASTFRFDTAIPNNYRVTFTRTTNLASDLFTWASGAIFRPSDIGHSMKMLRDFSEESMDQVGNTVISAQNDAVTQATAQSAASATAAASSATAAASSATAASTSETNAATSATNAATSATNASSSATAASTSETNAAASAAAASTSVTNAATSATNAATSATNAATSATNAATAETNAEAARDEIKDLWFGTHTNALSNEAEVEAYITAGSYTKSAGDFYFDTTNSALRVWDGAAWQTGVSAADATNAAASAAAAATSATNAATSATNAASSASAASSSASAASSSASAASSSASAASTSETNASSSASAASTSETNAASSATAASSSASAASTSASNASTSETNAATSATNASTSASQAATSATNASTSATNAATSAADAQNVLNQLNDRYLGSHTNVADDDAEVEAYITGDANITKDDGDIYFDSTNQVLKYYTTASGWLPAASTTVIDTSNLGNVGNVTITAVSTGDIIEWNGSQWVNVANFSGSYSDLTNKPTIPADAGDLGDVTITTPATNQVLKYNGAAWVNTNVDYGELTGKPATFAPSAHTHPISEVTNLQTELDGKAASGHAHGVNDLSDVTITAAATGEVLRYNGSEWVDAQLAYGDLSGTPTLATVATSGAYADLTGAPVVGRIEQLTKTAGYTLLATDAGKHISTNSAITVNGGVHALGDAITIYNDSNANITITQGTNCTLRLAGSATTGNLTLAQYGVATILCVTDSATDVFVVSGGGLS